MVRITINDVEALLASRGYKLIGEYINTNVKILVECPNGHPKEILYHKFKKGHGCTRCTDRTVNGKKAPTSWTYEEVKEVVESYGYELIGEYINTTTHIKIKCKNGHITDKLFGHLRKGHLCNKCKVSSENERRNKVSQEEFKSALKEDGYSIIKSGNKSHDLFTIRCINGHITEKTPNSFKRSNQCKGCIMSSYEAEIYNRIKEFNISIIHEYVHPLLKTHRFDMAIFDGNLDKLIMIVEVDGEHHSREAFGKNDNLKEVKRRDEEKNEFCNVNNIELIRIPYNIIENVSHLDKFINDNITIKINNI